MNKKKKEHDDVLDSHPITSQQSPGVHKACVTLNRGAALLGY